MLNDIKTSTKLLLGVGCAVLAAIIIGMVGRQALVTEGEHIDDIGKNRMPSLYGVEEMVAGQLRVAAGQRGLVNTQMMDHNERQSNYDEIAAGFRQAAEGRRIYEALPMAPEEQRIWPQFLPRWDEWQRAVQTTVDISREKDALLSGGTKPDDPRIKQMDDRAMEVMGRAREARLDCSKMLTELSRLNNEYGKTAVQRSEASASKNISLMLAVMFLGTVIAVIVGILISQSVKRALSALLGETGRLSDAAMSGQLATRANIMAVPSEYRGIVQGMNDTLDAVINPLNVTSEYVAKISEGNIPPKITEQYGGDFNVIKNNLNQLVGTLSQFVDEMGNISKQHDAGDIDVKIPEERFEGAYRVMAKGVNDMVFGHIAVKKKAMACIAEFSRGNFDAELEKFPGKKAFINENVERMRTNVKSFVHEMALMSKEHDAGDIDVKIPEERFEGAYRVMAKGVNDMVFGHIAVKKKAMACISEFSRGNFDAELEKFPGKKAFINDNVERLRTNVKSFIHEMGRMSKEHDAGDIDVMIPDDRFEGAYRVMAKGVNDMVSGHISVKKKAMACIAEFGRGNFQAPLERFPGKKAFINETVEQVRANLKALIEDAEMLSRAAVDGKLTTRADVERHQGDFRKIIEGVNATLDSIIGPFIQVADSVEQVTDATRQIAASSQSVAQGTSEQASSLEETSSSLEEMSGMTKQNADNTVQAKALASSTKEAAEKGGQAMGRMTDAMEKIRAASEGTAQIIKDINEIAFQTNLLALNAAVEAARAGDAGRGFAVVAEEVRSLALRSKEAAKKTEDLIQMSVGHAENGRLISSEVANSLTGIVDAVSKVNDIIGEIAAASQEQSRGIEQVNKAVADMDKVVQAAASSAEESSSAAEELASQAEELSNLISRFELDRDNRGARRQSPSAREAAPARRTALHPATIPPRRGPVAAVRAKKPNGGNGHSRKPAPEEVIPLETDAEFQDF